MVAHAQALSIRPQLDFFGDLKSSKNAASKSLEEGARRRSESRPMGLFPDGSLDHQVARGVSGPTRVSAAQALFDDRTMRADPPFGAIRV